MSHTHVTARVELTGRTHTWTDSEGIVCSSLDLGFASITFDSADDARAVAARCTEIADAIDAMKREGEAGD